jgi:hypothetical protein
MFSDWTMGHQRWEYHHLFSGVNKRTPILLICAFKSQWPFCFLGVLLIPILTFPHSAHQTWIHQPVTIYQYPYAYKSSSMTDNSDKTSVQLWPWQKRALENGRTPLPESPGERPWLNLSPDTEISATPLTALINASTPKPRDCGEYHQIHVKTKHQLTSLTGCHTALPLVVRKWHETSHSSEKQRGVLGRYQRKYLT